MYTEYLRIITMKIGGFPLMCRILKLSMMAGLAVAAMTHLESPTVRGGTLTFDSNTTLSGNPIPNGSSLKAVITDVASDEVTIKMDASNLSAIGPQFISNWGFNIDPTLAFTSANLTVVGSPVLTGGVSAADAVTIGNDNGAFNPPSAGKFDVVFQWTGSDHSFQHGATVTYTLKYTGTGTLDAASFNFPTTGGDKAYTLTKIQGFGGSGELGRNTPGAVPEPNSLVLAAVASLVGLGVLARRRRTA
jgi:hypothetical protein